MWTDLRNNLKISLGVCAFGICFIGAVITGIMSIMTLFSPYFWTVPLLVVACLACTTVCVTLFRKANSSF